MPGRVKPVRMTPEKPSVQELQDILDGKTDFPVVTLPTGEVVRELPLSDLRANLGGFMNNVAGGVSFAITRKGKILAVLSPPPKRAVFKLEDLV
jgi:hypothetical protein